MENVTKSDDDATAAPNPLQTLRDARDATKDSYLWDDLASFENWNGRNTSRIFLKGLGGGPANGPPVTPHEQATTVRAMMRAAYDFTTCSTTGAVINPRTVKDICESAHLTPAVKIEKIMGRKTQVADAEIEFHLWKLMSVAIDVHLNGYEVKNWQVNPEPEVFTSFVGRWVAMAREIKAHKTIIKSLVSDEGFALRFILNPRDICKRKEVNATLNNKKADTIRIGRAHQSQATNAVATAAPTAPPATAPPAAGAPKAAAPTM